ncbi:MAG: hypothetical protein R2764_05770 [Bacteroidales bacterium]
MPGSSDNVTVLASAINWPTFTGDFALGSECNDMILEGTSQFTATGDISIPSGRTFTCNGLNDIFVEVIGIREEPLTSGTGAVNFIGNTSSVIDAGGTASNSLQTTFIQQWCKW